jgi:hypothetical protein
MTELITVVPPVLVGVAVAAWAGVVVRRLVKSNGGAAGE